MDLTTVDLLARLHLYARRRGLELRVRRGPRELAELLDLCGLAELLWEPEEREELRRVEEERQLPDPPA